MRIGIDFRLDQSGIGRYTERLITNIVQEDQDNEYVIFVNLKRFNHWEPPGKNITKVLANIPHYSVSEQLKFPGTLLSQKLDLVHFPHFNVPILYPKRFVVTIHDLTHTEHSTARASTKSQATFRAKKLGYDLAIRSAVMRSKRIIAVSEHAKAQIVSTLKAKPEKIQVIYEGFDPMIFSSPDKTVFKENRVAQPYWLAVGNFYPHKHLARLVESFALAKRDGLDGQLVIVGDYEGFDKPIRGLIGKYRLTQDVILTGRISDAQLGALYRQARGLAFVSLAEGFGLPALEALANDLPILASNAPALPEILGDAAYFVDPNDTQAIADGLLRVARDDSLRKMLAGRSKPQLAKYSWQKAAQETLEVYRDATR